MSTPDHNHALATLMSMRMGKLMDEARNAAQTDLERQRVALFDKGIWQYMVAGRKAYLDRQ